MISAEQVYTVKISTMLKINIAGFPVQTSDTPTLQNFKIWFPISKFPGVINYLNSYKKYSHYFPIIQNHVFHQKLFSKQTLWECICLTDEWVSDQTASKYPLLYPDRETTSISIKSNIYQQFNKAESCNQQVTWKILQPNSKLIEIPLILHQFVLMLESNPLFIGLILMQ